MIISDSNPVGIKIENLETLPGFAPSKSDASDMSNYSIRYSKIDLDDVGSRTELEMIETRSIRGDGIIMLTKEKFSFMDKFFLVISYMELNR